MNQIQYQFLKMHSKVDLYDPFKVEWKYYFFQIKHLRFPKINSNESSFDFIMLMAVSISLLDYVIYN